MVQAALVYAMIWAGYGFRYSTVPEPDNGQCEFYSRWNRKMAAAGGLGQAVAFAMDKHLLPEAYLSGIIFTYYSVRERLAFLNGQYSMTGWWYFYPYTLLVKTPLPLFLLMAIAAAGAVASWRRGQPGWSRAFGSLHGGRSTPPPPYGFCWPSIGPRRSASPITSGTDTFWRPIRQCSSSSEPPGIGCANTDLCDGRCRRPFS